MTNKKQKTILKCIRCQATADLSKSQRAWNGWQVLPKEICPDCIAKEMKARREAADKHAQRLKAAIALLEAGTL